jgi:hypothetical protein
MKGPFVAIRSNCESSLRKGNGSSRIGRKPEIKSYEECSGGGIPHAALPPKRRMIAIASSSDALKMANAESFKRLRSRSPDAGLPKNLLHHFKRRDRLLD